MTAPRFAFQPAPLAWMLGLGAAAGVAACFPRRAAPVFAAVLFAVPAVWYALSVEFGWIRAFFATALLLPPLALPWGDSGPHVAAVFAVTGAIAMLGQGGLPRLLQSPVGMALTAYLGALALSIGFACFYSGIAIGGNSAIRVGLFGISVLAYLAANRRDTQTMRVLLPAACAAAAIGCADYWFQLPAPAGYGPQYVWLDSGVYRRAQGFFYESSTLGTFCAFFLTMIAVVIVTGRWSRSARIALFPAAAVFGLAMLLSYSRGAIVCTLVAFSTLAILERRRWLRPRTMIGAAVCLIVVACAFAFIFPEFAQSYVARLAFTFENAASRPDRVLSGRLENWSTLIAFITAHPWQVVAGIGYKTLAYTEYLGRPVVADNAYLSALIETGIAGVLSLAALNAAIIRTAWKVARNAGTFYAKWIFCFWTGFSVQMLSGDVLTYWRILPLFFWVLGQAIEEASDADSAA